MKLGQPSWHIWVWIEKSYTLCHCITRSFLLQTTLNSISKRFSKYQIRVYLFRIRRGTTLGPWDKLSFKKPCIMWTDFTNCACKKVKKKISDRFSILWKQFFLEIIHSVSYEKVRIFSITFLDLCFILSQNFYTT